MKKANKGKTVGITHTSMRHVMDQSLASEVQTTEKGSGRDGAIQKLASVCSSVLPYRVSSSIRLPIEVFADDVS